MEPRKIGEGTYGCAYRPALRCLGQPRREGKISKYLEGSEADDEERVQQFIVRIPNYEKYFIANPERCFPDPGEISALSYPNKCLGKNADTLLIYDDGGTVHKLNNISLKELFYGYDNIISAARKIRSVGLAHLDIKPDNTLIDKYGTTRLIDFGLSVNISRACTNSNNDVFKQIYFPWPMEMALTAYDFREFGNISRIDFFRPETKAKYAALPFNDLYAIFLDRTAPKYREYVMDVLQDLLYRLKSGATRDRGYTVGVLDSVYGSHDNMKAVYNVHNLMPFYFHCLTMEKEELWREILQRVDLYSICICIAIQMKLRWGPEHEMLRELVKEGLVGNFYARPDISEFQDRYRKILSSMFEDTFPPM